MSYKVVKKFRDAESGLTYIPGNPYPKGGHEPSEERIKTLSTKDNDEKEIFIVKVGEVKPSDNENDNSEDEAVYTEADLKKLKKDQQVDLIKELQGDPEKTNNEDERVALILKLQEEKASK